MQTCITGDEIKLIKWEDEEWENGDFYFIFGGYVSPNFIFIHRIEEESTETYSYFVRVGATFTLPGTDMGDDVLIVRDINVEQHSLTLELIDKSDVSHQALVGAKRKIK